MKLSGKQLKKQKLQFSFSSKFSDIMSLSIKKLYYSKQE